jgi:hypothetical protein
MISIKFKKILEYPFDSSRCFLGGRVNHVSMCVSYDFDSFFWFIPTFHQGHTLLKKHVFLPLASILQLLYGQCYLIKMTNSVCFDQLEK